MLDILILIAGFIALILGANKLVDGASSLAKKFNIPNIVIGLTIVAFGTSAPELVVNIIAATENDTAMLLGNIMGSNIFNIMGILGICAIIYPLSVKKNTTWIEIPLSLLAAIAVLIIVHDKFFDDPGIDMISRTDGLLLILFFIIFLVYNFSLAIKSGPEEEINIKEKNYSVPLSILFIVLGLAGLVLGGKLIVMSAVNIAASFGLSQRVIGLTVIAIGTSLPELATSVVAVRKKKTDIAIGNVVGSNIFNIFFVLGISTIINPVVVAPASFIDINVNICASLLLFLFIFARKGRQIDRWEGFVLLLTYIGYMVFLILNSSV